MASSNIKLFDENKGNMLNDTEFNISTQRLNGLQTGVASSQLQNKAMYQASLMAYAIAQLMLANGQNANDTDAVSTFVNNLLASIVQKKLDKATQQDVEGGTVGKWISSELLKSNNEAIASSISAVDNRLTGQLANIQGNLGTHGHNCRIAIGSYVGTGTYGESNPSSLNFDFYPLLVFITSNRTGGYPASPCVLMRNINTAHSSSSDRESYRLSVSWSDNGVSWYSSSAAGQQENMKGSTYVYVVVGYDKQAEEA